MVHNKTKAARFLDGPQVDCRVRSVSNFVNNPAVAGLDFEDITTTTAESLEPIVGTSAIKWPHTAVT